MRARMIAGVRPTLCWRNRPAEPITCRVPFQPQRARRRLVEPIGTAESITLVPADLLGDLVRRYGHKSSEGPVSATHAPPRFLRDRSSFMQLRGALCGDGSRA